MERASESNAMEAEIAHLRSLSLQQLRSRWRVVFRKAAPEHLPRHLLFGILAYRLQAERYGDLDPSVKKLLDQMAKPQPASTSVERLTRFDGDRANLKPGTILMRHWNGSPQRVMVMAKGFGWNGKMFPSLSKVAFAITGTRWNGPRFFGLRDKKPPVEDDAGAAT